MSMRGSTWCSRMGRIMAITVPGMALWGTSCATDVRHAIVSAGLDFVEGTAGTVLETVFPIEDFLDGGN